MAWNKTLKAAAVALAASAAPSVAEGPRILDGVAMTGSPSLAMHALSSPMLPAPFHEARARIAHEMGLIGTPGQVTSKWLRFSPVLTYDTNINGGSTGESITLSGLKFVVAEEFRAKSGFLAGGSVSGGMRVNLAPLTALELNLSGMAAWAPEHEISKTRLTAAACVRRMVDDATQVRGCLDGYVSTYELGRTERYGAELGVSRAFATTSAFHEVTLSAKRNTYTEGENYGQTVLSAQYVMAQPHPYAVMAGVQVGTDTDDRISMRERVSLGLVADIWGKQTMFSVSAQNNRGGLFLGEGREERIYVASAGRDVTKKINLGVSYVVTKARHEFFDDRAVGFDFNYRF